MPPSLVTLVDARVTALLLDEQTALWHHSLDEPAGPPIDSAGFMGAHPLKTLVLALHRANFALWHAEDQARLPTAQDADAALAKRTIDRVNQARNDTVERIDETLLTHLAAVERAADAEQHSETPGMMIDRLSILSLKLFHTQEEMHRAGAPAGHRDRNEGRLAILLEQRYDLASCLDQVWHQICAGKRFFKRYQQLKMYNDPELNPVLYGARTR